MRYIKRVANSNKIKRKEEKLKSEEPTSKGIYDSLIKDLIFKNVFSKEKYFKDFMQEFLKYIGKEEAFEVKEITTQKLLQPQKKNEKIFYADVVALLSNDKYISLEAYSSDFGKREFNKSFAYGCRLFCNQEFADCGKMKKVLSINLIRHNYKKMNDKVINEYKYQNVVTEEVIDENMVIYLVRYDLAKESKEDSRFIKYLRLLDEDDEEKMKKITKGDELMDEVADNIISWNKSEMINSLEDILIERGYKARWEEEAKESGLIEGINKENYITSEKDGKWPSLKELKNTDLFSNLKK